MRMRINGEAADIVIMIWMKSEDGDHDNHDNYDDDHPCSASNIMASHYYHDWNCYH